MSSTRKVSAARVQRGRAPCARHCVHYGRIQAYSYRVPHAAGQHQFGDKASREACKVRLWFCVIAHSAEGFA